LNKKLVYIFAVLVAGVFLISACQQDAVGKIPMNRNIIGDDEMPIINVIPKRNTVIIPSLTEGQSYGGLTLNGVYAGIDQNRNYIYCDINYRNRRENIIEGEVGSVSVPGEDQSYVAVLATDMQRGGCKLILIK